MNENTLKYLALGILAGCLAPYLLALIKKPQQPTQTSEKEESEEIKKN